MDSGNFQSFSFCRFLSAEDLQERLKELKHQERELRTRPGCNDQATRKEFVSPPIKKYIDGEKAPFV